MGKGKAADATGFWARYTDLAPKDLPVIVNTGIPSSTLSTYKTEKRFPRADEAARIAKSIGTTVEYLVSGLSPTETFHVAESSPEYGGDPLLPGMAIRYKDLLYDLDDLDAIIRGQYIGMVHGAAETARAQKKGTPIPNIQVESGGAAV